MARLLIEGFESGSIYATSFDTVTHEITSAEFPAGFSGTYQLRDNTGSKYSEKTFGSSLTQIFVAMKIYLKNSSVNSCGILAFYDSGGTVVGSVVATADVDHYHIDARRGGQTSTVLATGTVVIPMQSTCLIEVNYLPDDSNGVFKVKVNGVLDIDIDTDDAVDTTAGLENVKRFRVGYESENGGGYNLCVDDVVVDDADWIGNTRIQKLQINAAGATTAVWTASTGNPYQCVDEIPYSDTDYIYTNVTNNCDTYGCADLTGTIQSIKGIVLHARGAYEGSPTPTKQMIVIKSGEVQYSGELFTPSLTFGYYSKMWEKNPIDGVTDWTVSDINSLEIGVKAAA